MSLINLILDLVALLLWVNWVSVRLDQGIQTSGVSLIRTLRKAEPGNQNRWRYLAALVALLVIRAMVFVSLTSASQRIDLGIITISFRGGMGLSWLGNMLLFSVLDFAITLSAFYTCLVLLSVVNAKLPDNDPVQRLVRGYFRWLENWPRAVKVFLPLLIGVLFWLVLQPVLARIGIVPRSVSNRQFFEQCVFIGAAAYLPWKYLIVGILLLNVIYSYVYLGSHSAWTYVNLTARNLLNPISWLPVRAGKVDFLPLIGIALVLLLTEAFSRLTLSHPRWLPF
jgi:hypothetical protein